MQGHIRDLKAEPFRNWALAEAVGNQPLLSFHYRIETRNLVTASSFRDTINRLGLRGSGGNIAQDDAREGQAAGYQHQVAASLPDPELQG